MTLPIGDKPWLPNAAIRWLDGIIKPDWHIFEWGAGGSTLWFARRAATVEAVEGDAAWASQVLERAKGLALHNVSVQHVQCEHESGPFEKYAAAIIEHPRLFDLILIDGANGSRLACAHRAITKAKIGGYIMLDNSGAAAHLEARDFLDTVFPLAERWIDEVYAVTPEHAGKTENSVWRA